MADDSNKGTPPQVLDRPAGPDDKTLVQGEGGEEATPAKPQFRPPYVIVLEGPRSGARISLSDGPNVIGRAQESQIKLEDQSVSRSHAEIKRTPSGWMVHDLGSKNGTFVNGKLITEGVVIGHKDVIKTGIYQLRLITQPISVEEEVTIPPELATIDRTIFNTAPGGAPSSQAERTDKPKIKTEPLPEWSPSEEGETAGEGVRSLEEGAPPARKLPVRTIAMVSLLAVVLIATAAYFGHRLFFSPKAKVAATVQPPKMEGPLSALPAEIEAQAPPVAEAPPAVPPEGAAPLTGETPIVPPAIPEAGVPQVAPAAPGPTVPANTMPVFLDFVSSPMPVKVSFMGKELGTTPLRVNVELEPGKDYQAEAVFEMPEVQQRHPVTAAFKAEPGTSVIPVFFRGPVGIVKINDIPRDVEFYLEGNFSYDRFQEQSAKLTQVVLQKPVYVPFGQYSLELRRSKKLGASSPTYVPDIIFRRNFQIAEDSPLFALDVREDDLSVFPVEVRTEPENAQVFVDGKQVGKTPFKGNFPLGEHKLTLRKEGYFEHSEDLKVDINVPFIASVKLKTSVAGAHINNARLAMNRAMYQDAINELAQALSSQPVPAEITLSNYLLGVSYLKIGDIPRAVSYFTEAKAGEAEKYPAQLGLVECYATMQRMDDALPLLVEVLLKAKEENVIKDAHDLFQKISPFRSIIYVYSEPAGASVTVNDAQVTQKTPVILHEMPLGNYRMRVEKPGYLPTDLSLTLSVNEFNPVIVRLKPIPK